MCSMLMAAHPTSTRGLDLFRLALELAERSESGAQPEVVRYFDDLLSAAKALGAATGPQEVAQLAKAHQPEAIQLASAMLRAKSLRLALSGIDALAEVPAERATEIRRELDLAIAP